MLTPRPALVLCVVAATVVGLSAACADGGRVILATGTTPHDSGLLDELVPIFEEETGHRLIVVPVGTGQALEMGRRGDADVLLGHDAAAEERFVADGYGANRRLIMHNEFVIVGPADDPAGVARAGDATSAMRAIARSEAGFISRGDDSGTHGRELMLWGELGIDPAGEPWYEESGQGMGQTLLVAAQRGAYTLSDRGTYLALRDVLELEVLFQGDPALLNVYHVMQVNPDRLDGVNAEGAAAFVAFLLSDEAQALIGEFGVDRFGRPLFVPDAGKTEDELREQ